MDSPERQTPSFGRQKEEPSEGNTAQQRNACDLSNCVAGRKRERKRRKKEEETSLVVSE